ncbi:hypothetical protein BAMTA208_08505 [Bacillus amyloliquefaciens TA208]|nr:hypothetical protein BAMTA208_08505 [Bacillus amyloliquefaciens TA208]
MFSVSSVNLPSVKIRAFLPFFLPSLNLFSLMPGI